ncbi:hypothetical protein G4B88_012002 [Cannabis sativa]|uniref:Uncharacterized protein n=1 Tax=Cannabis sativa TaxID=3483 RepID=A0A7J6HCF2_CANSA|nr:hypothetical protein G4B88_012002 [Cannabis sativa]
MNIRTRIFHGVPHTSLSCQVHHMGESHNLEKLLQQGRVINISFHDKHPGSLQKRLPSSFQRRIIVIVKAIESKHSVSTAFQSRGHVTAPVTNTEIPFRDRTRADDRTRFSQAAPPQLYVLRERREGSDERLYYTIARIMWVVEAQYYLGSQDK